MASIISMLAAVISAASPDLREGRLSKRYAGLYDLAASCAEVKINRLNAEIEESREDILPLLERIESELEKTQMFRREAISCLDLSEERFYITHELMNVELIITCEAAENGTIAITALAANNFSDPDPYSTDAATFRCIAAWSETTSFSMPQILRVQG